ncbi:YdbH domain-containing protein [Colwellia demingiae]|uniref:YdbH domain-containing protein n=1 Tax=Colwellia demingiae TaxID=89401 RepID=UPI001FE5F755|nr:YdbH domain-containing protein [Colwellia demingiae]
MTSIVNNYLTQHNSALTCIDFEINNNFDLLITRLCIDSPYAEIELINSLVEWRFEPSKIDVDKLSDAISAINIDAVTVRAKSDIQFPENTTSSTVKITELPTLIRKQLHDLALLSIPIEVDIQTFSYQPLTNKETNKQTHKKTNQSHTYQGQFSVNAQKLSFSLANHKKESVFSLALTKNGDDLSADLATDLAKLRPFIIRHQTALPLSLSTLLINESWSVKGNFNSQLDWQKKTLNMTSKLTDFSFEASQDSSSLGPIELDTTFTWQTVLAGENLHFDFTHEDNLNNGKTSHLKDYERNNIQLAFNSEKLIDLLTVKAVDQQIINVITDNAINSLTVKPLGSLTIDFTQQTIASDSLDISSRNLYGPIELSLSDLLFNFDDDPAITTNLQKAKLSLTGQANIAQLQTYSQQPVKLSVIGGIEQYSNSWQLTLSHGTIFELVQLSLPLNKSASEPTRKSKQSSHKAQPSMKSLISHWQGEVSIAKNDNQQQSKNNGLVTFELDINSQISQLNYPKTLKINGLELKTKLSGSVDDITIGTKVVADNVPIATAMLTGDLRHPSVVVSAQDVLLTDLLALKIKLPVELKLIDGNIDYHLSGQLKNSEDLLANPMTMTLVVQEVTGEVDGTWLQELNWQQKLLLQNGQIQSIRDKTEASPNLTIAKIETATPINNLATSTFIDFSSDNLKLLAYDIRGSLLGGRFDIAKAQWPFSKELPVNVTLTKIDLEKLLELDKKQGIVVTGRVSGELPIHYDGDNFLIKEGNLKNVGDGIIQVYNNPAVEELKASSTELKLAFNALENLHYHHLSSEVSMADDGYMLLDTAIKGRNPDLDNDVNLNLNLSYDLLGLIESLNITEDFESKIIKGLQKTKN